jgi:3-hydroxyacyl-CoA dehydrogenase / 3-hydroxy-2-methylbutyryl-CoA dehydrogenase
MELKGKTALVTGGASGLGRATAERLLAAGMNVVILDREQSDGAKVAQALGKNVHFEASDVTSAELVKKAVDAAVSKFGGLHAAINCAGVGTAEPGGHLQRVPPGRRSNFPQRAQCRR